MVHTSLQSYHCTGRQISKFRGILVCTEFQGYIVRPDLISRTLISFLFPISYFQHLLDCTQTDTWSVEPEAEGLLVLLVEKRTLRLPASPVAPAAIEFAL